MSQKLRILVSAGLLTWFAWRTDWVQLGQTFAHLRLELWVVAVLVYIVAQFVSALRWQWLARPLGFEQSLSRYISYYFIGMYFNLLLPTSVGGDVVRAWYLDGGSRRRLAAFATVFVDRFSGLLVLLTLACVAVCLCPTPIPGWITLSVWGTVAGAVLGLAGLPILSRWTSRLDRMRRLVGTIQLYLSKPWLLFGTALLSLFVQAANVIIVWLVGHAIAAPVPASYYWVFVPMVTLLTLLPVSVSGMGVREGGMILFLAPLGVDEATAVSLAFLWFSVFTAASLCGAGVYLVGSFPRLEEQPHDGFVRGDPDQGRMRQPKAAA